MKKTLKSLCAAVLAFALLLVCVPAAQAANVGGEYIAAQGAYIMDFETGAELYSLGGDTRRVPASMTKVMSVYLMLEAVQNGEISLDTVVPISSRVYTLSRDTSYYNTVPLHYNQVYTVDEMIDLILVYLASAAVVAVAELISGNEAAFVQRMNDKAAQMGIDAKYVCSSGIGMNYISPRAMAVLARNIITDFPDVLRRTAKKSVSFHGSTYNNTNLLLSSMYYEGVDGLKSGTTNAAGYCFCGTAYRNGVRLITVVMSSSSATQRYTDTKRLLDYGFSVRDEVIAGLTPTVPDGSFRDVSPKDWFYESVMLMKSSDIMRGVSSTEFAPYMQMTRAMAVAALYRADGEPEVAFAPMFLDVPEETWYADAVVWARQYGIADGYPDGEFKGGRLITRAELVTMFYNYAYSKLGRPPEQADLGVYSDAGDIDEWAMSAMSWAVASGLVRGTSPTTLSPDSGTDRSQCAVMLDRLFLYFSEKM